MSLITGKLPVSGTTTITLKISGTTVATYQTDSQGNIRMDLSDSNPNTSSTTPGYQSTSYTASYSGAFAPAGSENWSVPVPNNLAGNTGVYDSRAVVVGSPLW
jgi:hypothetical protein